MANEERYHFFLQSVFLDGEEIPRELIIKSNYIEHITLKSPLLIFDLHDFTREYIDNKKIKAGSVLSVTMGDPVGEGQLFKEDYHVVSYPLENDVIKIQAVSAGVAELMERASKPIYLTNQPPDSIISLFSTRKLDIDPDSREMTFHLNNGEKPAYPLMRMAKENGSSIWQSRGTLFLRKYDSISGQEPSFKYEANNPDAEFTINKLRHVANNYLASQVTDVQYVGFNANEGFQASGSDGRPIKMVSSGDPQTIANMNKLFVPKIDIECDGNPSLFVGMVIEVMVYRYSEDNIADESIPKKMIVGAVTHNEDRVTFRTRAILGVFE